MQLQDTKSLLAKLMATENLAVEHRNVATAMFDVKNRVLVIPVLDNKINSHTYDLFVGHEVGHALYTPMEGLIKGRAEKVNSSILNVVEDSRIERKIKHKYPGLRNSFVQAYKELFAGNFFGTNNINLNELNFIDRLNLHCKIGPSLAIKFEPIEKVLLNDVETTQTYDQVIEVSKRIIAYMKEKEEEYKEKMKSEDSENSDGETGDEDDTETDGETGDKYTEDSDSDFDDGVSEETSDNDANDGEEYEDTDSDDRFDYKEVEEDNVRSFTDDAYKQNEKKLFAENTRAYVYANIPKFDLDKGIASYKELYKRIKDYDRHLSIDSTDNSDYLKLRQDTNKIVSYLVKEFELRKNAEQLKRASTSKTGDLDMKKIFSYQFNDDIFKKISVVPGGKSHGLVMFLDWSGSMSTHLKSTIKQLLSLVIFCKKVNIPYEVYAFATPAIGCPFVYTCTPKEGDLATPDHYLMNLLSSKMTAGEFTFAASCLVKFTQSMYSIPDWIALQGTPLNEAVIAAMEIIPHFRKQYKLQVVNTVFLTDGEGHNLNWVHRKNEHVDKLQCNQFRSRASGTLVIRDPVSKQEELMDNVSGQSGSTFTSGLIKLLKAKTNCNILGFYIISNREFGRKVLDLYPRGAIFQNYDLIKSNFKKNKFVVVETAGFDEYYVISSGSEKTNDDPEFEVNENATTRGLVSAFSKYTAGRVANRVVLNRFIGMIT